MQQIHASAALHVLHFRDHISHVSTVTSVDITWAHGTLFPQGFARQVRALILILLVFFNILLHLIHLNSIEIQRGLLLLFMIDFLFAE